MHPVQFVEQLKVGDLVLANKEFFGLITEIRIDQDDEDEDYYLATVRWIDGYPDTPWTDGDLEDDFVYVLDNLIEQDMTIP